MAELRYKSSLVTIRNPLLSNQLTLHLRTNIGRAMSGAFWAYKTTPARRTLNVSFANFNRNQILQVRDFLLQSRGAEVWYVDHNDQTWHVKIRTEALSFEHAAIRNNQFSLEMEVYKSPIG